MDLPSPDIADPADTAREVAAGQVLTLYRTLLKRTPRPAERDRWIDALLNGLQPEAAAAAIQRSPEYQELQRSAPLMARILATGLFDADWYLERYPDVAAAGFDPLRHYCGPGRREQRAPNPYFVPQAYREQAGLGGDADPLLDYAERGEAAGLAPGPYFDPYWYREAYGSK